jgi:hypothetical protein
MAAQLLKIPIGGRQSLQRSDLPNLPGCSNPVLTPCFAAFRQSFGPPSLTSPCGGINLAGAQLVESVVPKASNGCPQVPTRTGPGCIVNGSNQLASITDPSKPCVDVQALCINSPLPTPGPSDPPNTCTMQSQQTISFQGVVILNRTITTTITNSAFGCTVTIQ